jgi:hypothetical protein
MNAHSEITAAPPKVYAAIAAVTLAMSKEGISKDRRNQQQGYNFRGIDEVYNALSPMLAQNKLCILPRMISRSQEERTTAKGGAIFYTTVEAEFDFVSAEDGSVHVVRTFGEAMDSADKSTNKAMSAAYKYAAMQTFCIPTEGDNDADATTHEVQAREPERKGTKAASIDDIEPAGGWGDWARWLIGEVAKAEGEFNLDELKNDPANKARINALKKVDKTMFEDVGKAFAARRAVLADEVPF